MKRGRGLQVGQDALTDYNGGSEPTRVTITARQEEAKCPSGILFQVTPRLNNGTAASWYDADWFWPVSASATEGHCTCPSGDGSLRSPCPAHPPESS